MERNVAKRVVGAFGGLTEMSKATGWPVSTIQGWTETGNIPTWRRDRIITIALRDAVRLPREFLEAEAA